MTAPKTSFNGVLFFDKISAMPEKKPISETIINMCKTEKMNTPTSVRIASSSRTTAISPCILIAPSTTVSSITTTAIHQSVFFINPILSYNLGFNIRSSPHITIKDSFAIRQAHLLTNAGKSMAATATIDKTFFMLQSPLFIQYAVLYMPTILCCRARCKDVRRSAADALASPVRYRPPKRTLSKQSIILR